MRQGDLQKGFPATLYTDITANIEGLTGVPEGSIAYSTDDNKFGSYDGAAWTWLSSGVAISLDANADTLLSLAAGVIGLDTQAAHKVLIGRVDAGADTVPTWRVLAAADIPDLSATYEPHTAFLTSIGALGTAANKMIYTTAENVAAETDITADARLLLADADVPRLSTENTWTGAQGINLAAGEALIVRDASGNKKFSLAWSTNVVTLDVFSPEPTNEISNGTFETDLTGWSAAWTYLLRDLFTTDRAAGAVNGTASEPGPGGNRIATDTNSKISIASGLLTFATGAANNDGVWLTTSVARAYKNTLVWKVTPSDTNGIIRVGWDSNTSGSINDALVFDASGVLKIIPNGGTAITVGAYTATTYYVAAEMRATGIYWYIYGGAFAKWQLLWITAAGTGAGYGAVQAGSATSVFTADFMHAIAGLGFAPLCYDTFTRADGAIGSSETTGPDGQTTPSLSWTGGAISSNKNVITPSLGSELLTNGDMSSSTGWTFLSAGWAIGSGVLTATTVGRYTEARQGVSNSSTTGQWYQGTVDVSGVSSGDFQYQVAGMLSTSNITNGAITRTVRSSGTTAYPFDVKATVEGQSAVFDNASLKPLTLSSLFSTVSTSDTDVVVSSDVTMTAGTQAGIVTNLDSTSSPANLLIAYHDGVYVKLDKNVGGTYTNLISAVATYGAGYTLRVITYTSSGSLKVRVYYNNALIGSEQTVSDAGIISNTKHGLFSTYSGNSFDNFLLARGTGGEYADIPVDELTITRDTGTKRNGTASMKCVAGGNNANAVYSLNVGDTQEYTFYCYAYTGGGAVTAADVQLWYDGAILETTITVDSGGWYKLTGTLTGVASAKDFGLRVMAGKTVYVDDVTLQAGTGDATTIKILNSGTGVASLEVEGNIKQTAPPVLALGSDADDIIAALQAIGLVTES